MSNRILIVGAGKAGRTLASDLASRDRGVVVGFLDDALEAADVLGPLSAINDVIERHDVSSVYIALPSVESRVVRDVVSSIHRDDIELAIVPRSWDILTRETVRIEDLTDIDVLDLVGRKPVKHDLESAREFMHGRTVMVTGAAGSIGSRLISKLLLLEPAQVIGIDRWENGIFQLGRQFESSSVLDLRIGDITNTGFLDHTIATTAPSVIYHAAAYKHVPLMERSPREAICNNLGGTMSLIDAAVRHGVEHVVLVSTDKAVNPANIMGSTKRLGEIAMEAFSRQGHSTRLNAVRFGNVIESSGSVMQIFREQISRGAPLSVTHRDVTRYFMTLDEAAQLIIQTTLLGNAGEVFVLDMGDPVRIVDLATSLIKATRPELTVEFVGMRPGEKMFEELSYDEASVSATAHDSIFVTRDAFVDEPEQILTELHNLVSDAQDFSLSESELTERFERLVTRSTNRPPAVDR